MISLAPRDEQAEPGLVLAGDHADRDRPAGQRVLGGVGTQAAAGTPDQDVVTLLHRGAVVRDQLPEGRSATTRAGVARPPPR